MISISQCFCDRNEKKKNSVSSSCTSPMSWRPFWGFQRSSQSTVTWQHQKPSARVKGLDEYIFMKWPVFPASVSNSITSNVFHCEIIAVWRRSHNGSILDFTAENWVQIEFHSSPETVVSYYKMITILVEPAPRYDDKMTSLYCYVDKVKRNAREFSCLWLLLLALFLMLSFLLPFPGYQTAAHHMPINLQQDRGGLAAVRPLQIPNPPPLISSTKPPGMLERPGGSITQVRTTLRKVYSLPCLSHDCTKHLP